MLDLGFVSAIMADSSLQEVVKYRSKLFSGGVPSMVLGASARKWRTLPAKDQQIIKGVGKAVQNDFAKLQPTYEAYAKKKIQAAGVKYIDDFSEADRLAFFNAASEVWKETCAAISDEALKNVEMIQKAVGR